MKCKHCNESMFGFEDHEDICEYNPETKQCQTCRQNVMTGCVVDIEAWYLAKGCIEWEKRKDG